MAQALDPLVEIRAGPREPEDEIAVATSASANGRVGGESAESALEVGRGAHEADDRAWPLIRLQGA